MSKGFKLFMSCKEAVNTCDKAQYGEVTLLDKIKHTIHLFYCKTCQKYSANNKKLTELVNKPEVDCLKKSEKEQLQYNFKKELENHQ
ncbi:glycine dehydrogenase [Pontimicrobium aquaticum]|uniref:Glycine dehydrogenase n=1 Tax=Pontimicrobium aquaticum TaxID=2565367 RepID=A0A4U0F0A1_9FLAO|nr:glycine dehydrogenase [Pontimicrobium aquaticum]TJY37144.1 glycine dehydrogenase [Pontimicrobium aquaticum]